MDTISLILGLFLFILFVLPIVYVIVKQKSKDSKSQKMLLNLASENNMQLDKIEIIGHTMLGYDSNSRKLMVIEYGNFRDFRLINLNEVDEIRIAQKVEKAMQGAIRKERIVHLGLEFCSRNLSIPTEITFYDEDDYDSTDADIRLNDARKWDALLQPKIAV